MAVYVTYETGVV